MNTISHMKPVDNKELRKVISTYLSNEQTKPMVIISKPSSGRTTTIKEVANELGISNCEIIHPYSYDSAKLFL